MIVKNEEKHLANCLTSISDMVDEIIIVDTGSTDKTKEIAERFNSKIFDFNWINDFSVARNFAISKSSCDLILYLDADETINPNSKFELQSIKNSKSEEAYYCTVISYDNENSRNNSMRYVRLFPRKTGIRFTGKIHEQIVPSLIESKIEIRQSNVLINHYGYDISADHKKLKAARNLSLLLEEYEEADSPYYAFQLGNTYSILNGDDKAKEYFKIAAESNKLDKIHRTQSYTSLALYSHRNFNSAEAESYIKKALELNAKQPFVNLVAAKIFLRNGNLSAAEEKCMQAFLLNQNLERRQNNSSISITVDSEEIIYFGLALALKADNQKKIAFYKNELFKLYNTIHGKNNKFSEILNKLFSNSNLAEVELSEITGFINKQNLNFVLQIAAANPNKQQVLKLIEQIHDNFGDEGEVTKMLALMYEENGRIDDAIDVLEKLTYQSENDASIQLYLLSFYLKKGEFGKIIPLMSKIENKFADLPIVIEKVNSIKNLLKPLLKLS